MSQFFIRKFLRAFSNAHRTEGIAFFFGHEMSLPSTPGFLQNFIKKLQIVENKQNNVSLWGVAWMSFFWSTASLMVASILPTFMTDVLGANKKQFGMIAGMAVFMAFLAKVFSGILSDYVKTRKPLIVIGTFLSILIKPMFAIAGTVTMMFTAQSLDRLIKGIRSAPTDALIADLSPKSHQGASYGVRQSLYTFGGMFGALLASLLMHATQHDYRLIFMLSMIPATLALCLVLFFVKQPPILEKGKKVDWHIRDIKLLSSKYWALLGVVSLLMLARFDIGFLNFRAKESGWDIASLPLIIVLLDLIHASMAYPMGFLADKVNRFKMLRVGLILTVCAHLSMIADFDPAMILLGILFVGLYLGIMQGLLAALVAESTPAHLRGTAFALFYLSEGTSVLIGNYIAGHLSDINNAWPFIGGATFTVMAIVALSFFMRRFR